MARGRIKGPSFVVTRRIYVKGDDASFLDRCFNTVNLIYNDVLEEAERRVKALKEDEQYIEAKTHYAKAKKAVETIQKQIPELEDVPLEERTKDQNKELSSLLTEFNKVEAEASKWGKVMNERMAAYKLNEYELHAYVAELKRSKYNDLLGITVMQKIATSAWQAEEKVLFGNGKKVHYRKYGKSNSFESKKPDEGIIYHPANPNKKKCPYEHVVVCGRKLRLKPIRKKDYWLQEAMCSPVKYCRIIRKPFGRKYRYFLQIIMRGASPIKHRIGTGSGGLDPGVSTMTYDTDDRADMIFLSKNIAKYQKEIKKASIIYERRRRMANPQNYNENGTIKKDSDDFKKTWIHTKGMGEALMHLKTAYRKMAEYVKQSNGYDTNRILMQVSLIHIEKMDYIALQKRAKECKRQKKASIVKTKQGKKKIVFKYKRRKRFGASILKHAPAQFLKELERKILCQDGTVLHINPWKFKASQYDHVEDAYKKHELSERTKRIGGHLVQRDAYSAFLMHHATDIYTVDRNACIKDFRNYLGRQGKMVARILHTGDLTGNFGLKDFLNSKNNLVSHTV